MQINEAYWGGADKRQPVSGVYGFEITTYDLKTALNTDFLPLNEELDTSIAPWSINPNSGIAGLYYPTFWRVGEENKATGNLERIHDADDVDVNGVPFYFALPEYSGNGGFTFNWTARNGYSQATIQDTTPNNLRDRVYPVTNFDYSRLAYYVQLVVADYKIDDVTNDSTFWANGTMTLDNYINNQVDRPILGLRFIPYYATYEDYPNDRTQIELLMNSLGKKQPLQSTTAELIGYDVDYIDDFMTINAANVNTSMPTIGTYGIYASYTIAGDGQWATNASDSLKFNYTIDRTNLPIAHCIRGWHVTTKWTGAASIYYRTELRPDGFESYDKLKDYILTEAAFLGTWFCTDATDIATTEPGSTENWYLGQIGQDGITTGQYERGANTANYENSTWGENPWENSPWQGRSDDPTPYDKSLTSSIIRTPIAESFGTKTYLMTETALKGFIDLITYTSYQSAQHPEDFADDQIEAFGTEDPISLIESIVVYPMDMRMPWGGQSEYSNVDENPLAVTSTNQISIGNTTVTLNGLDGQIYLLDPYTSNPAYAPKSLNYFQRYHSFLDYNPYCSAQLQVPFCGSSRIDPEIFVGHKIGVLYDVDILSGSCKAWVLRDGLAIDTLTGNIGARVSVSAQDFSGRINAEIQTNASLQAQKWKQQKNYATMAASTIGGLVAGTATAGPLGGAVAGGMAFLNGLNNVEATEKQMQNAEYALESTEMPFKQILTGSGFLSQWDEWAVRLNVFRPTFLNGYTKDDFGDYGHTVGFACLKYDTLSNYSGLTVCSSADLTGVAATDKEISMIKQALQTGVYLPTPTE